MITKPVIKSDHYFDHIDEYVYKNEFIMEISQNF